MLSDLIHAMLRLQLQNDQENTRRTRSSTQLLYWLLAEAFPHLHEKDIILETAFNLTGLHPFFIDFLKHFPKYFEEDISENEFIQKINSKPECEESFKILFDKYSNWAKDKAVLLHVSDAITPSMSSDEMHHIIAGFTIDGVRPQFLPKNLQDNLYASHKALVKLYNDLKDSLPVLFKNPVSGLGSCLVMPWNTNLFGVTPKGPHKGALKKVAYGDDGAVFMDKVTALRQSLSDFRELASGLEAQSKKWQQDYEIRQKQLAEDQKKQQQMMMQPGMQSQRNDGQIQMKPAQQQQFLGQMPMQQGMQMQPKVPMQQQMMMQSGMQSQRNDGQMQMKPAQQQQFLGQMPMQQGMQMQPKVPMQQEIGGKNISEIQDQEQIFKIDREAKSQSWASYCKEEKKETKKRGKKAGRKRG